MKNVSDVLRKMRRGLAGQNVSQRAPRVVLECVVVCVAVYDTSDTFLFRVLIGEKIDYLRTKRSLRFRRNQHIS